DEIDPLLRQDLVESRVQGVDPLDFAAQHEEAQIYLARGDLATARNMEQEVLRQLPTFVSAMNNISQTYLLEGNIEQAIAITRSALATE
ncbi:hypothetical protein Q8G48_28385, partial [Klebsiella pneumoniae]|uniref:tetratricopeptide repeat protein n=1 Tax=Klebsiella pneumoniae TaxID=573 RepID=UPI0030134B39